MKTKRKLKYSQISHGCEEEVALFKSIFGEETFVTEKKAMSVAHSFYWDWLAEETLSEKALKSYEESRDQARKIYWEIYRKARGGLPEADWEVINQAWESLPKARAKAWAREYINDKEDG